jgi:hypothetical protein
LDLEHLANATGQGVADQHYRHHLHLQIFAGLGAGRGPLIEPHARAVDALPSWEATLAFVAADVGETAVAREAFERVMSRGVECIRRNGHYLTTVGMLADACAILGDKRRAAQLHACLLPYASDHIGIYAVVYRGTVSRSLGALSLALGDTRSAIRWFEHAVHESSRVGARPFEARSLYDLARAILRSGRSNTYERAIQVLERGLELAAGLGMSALERSMLEIGLGGGASPDDRTGAPTHRSDRATHDPPARS